MQPTQTTQTSTAKLLLAIILLLDCFALPSQFYLLATNGQFNFFGSVVRFFSFFTVLTNTMVAITSAILLLGKGSAYNFFNRNTTLTAITVYIVIVGLVYNVILRPLENLQGIYRVNTEIFHTIVPLLFLLYWIVFVPKQNMSWGSLPYWLIYPLLYVIFTLLHGKYSGFYPYPFIDVNKLGLNKALTNGAFVMLAFVLLSALAIGVGKWSREK
jgi:hypothetical protein